MEPVSGETGAGRLDSTSSRRLDHTRMMNAIGRRGRVLLIVPALLAGVPNLVRRHRRPAAEGAAAAAPFIARNCRACHNAVLKNAGLDFDAHPLPASLATSPEVWEKVIEKMRTGQMPPPPGLARPSDAEVAAVTGWIEGEIEAAEAAAARPRARHRPPPEPHGIQQHGAGPARRGPPARRRLPAGRRGLRLRQHRRRALALARADGEVPGGRGEGLPGRPLRPRAG